MQKVKFGGIIKGKGGIGFFIAFQHASMANNWKQTLMEQFKKTGIEVNEIKGYYDGR